MPDLTTSLMIECALLLPLGGAFALIRHRYKELVLIDQRWVEGVAALFLAFVLLTVEHRFPSPYSPAGLIALAAAAVYTRRLMLAAERYQAVPRTPADRRAWDALCAGLVLVTALLHIPSAVPPLVRVLPVAVLALVTHFAPFALLPASARRRGKDAPLASENALCILVGLWGVRLTAALILPALETEAGPAALALLNTLESASSVAGWVIIPLFLAALIGLRYQIEMARSRRIHRRYDSMFENNTAVLLMARCADGRLVDANPAAAAFYGIERARLAGMTLEQLCDAQAGQPVGDLCRAALTGSPQQEMHHRLADGTRRYVRISSSRILEDGLDLVLCTVTDLSTLRAEAEQAAFLSKHDQLTGVFSRHWLQTHLAEAEARLMQQPGGLPIAESDTTVLSLDINNLHTINEQRGIPVGDQVLVEVAAQLKNLVPPRTPIARAGGDEFLVLLHDTRTEQAYAIVRRLELIFQSHPRLGFPVGLACGMATADECGGHLQAACALAENRLLEDKLNRSDSLLSAPIQTLLALLRERYIETEEHALRLKDLSLAMARAIGLPASQFANLELLANLHDIGKIAINENILLKAGPLDDSEWMTMRQHPDIGARIVNLIPHASTICEDIRSHHERWDGTGYPRGLSGEDIPLLARIVSLADSWDAMTHDRPYKPAMKWTDAIREIDAGRGWQFDPKLADVFLRMVGG